MTPGNKAKHQTGTSVKALRSKYWGKLQQIADEHEEGNLNHLCNKAFKHYIAAVARWEKNKAKIK